MSFDFFLFLGLHLRFLGLLPLLGTVFPRLFLGRRSLVGGLRGAELRFLRLGVHGIQFAGHFEESRLKLRSLRYETSRRLVAKIEEPSALFPNLDLPSSLRFAPCEFEGQPDDLFVFNFAGGGKMELTVRAISVRHTTGYYSGRLLSAKGDFNGSEVDVRDYERLAFFGSRDAAEMTMPILVVRTSSDSGSDDDSCGAIFTPYNDLPTMWGGWAAYHMTCDEKIGDAIEISEVTYPPHYIVP